jgi:hypothetical protein
MSDDTQPPGELILRAWQLKAGGEAFFEGVARRFPDRAADLELLAAVERSACALVEPVARSYGLDLDVQAVRVGVREHLENLGPDLEAILQESAELGRRGHDLYRQLGETAPGDHTPLADQLGAIEDAAIAFMGAMVDGTSEARRSELEAMARTDRRLQQ